MDGGVERRWDGRKYEVGLRAAAQLVVGLDRRGRAPVPEDVVAVRMVARSAGDAARIQAEIACDQPPRHAGDSDGVWDHFQSIRNRSNRLIAMQGLLQLASLGRGCG